MSVIELRGVTRRFGDLVAVDEVDLQVGEGEIVGLLGHNGAGKTTLIRIINGLLTPHGGSLAVHGLDPVEDGLAVRSRTGVLTEYPALEAYLSPRENLDIHASINGMDRARAAATIQQLLDRLGLADRADEPVRKLSAGLKQRVALARALLHDPTLLLLDEPTTNMDPVAAREVRALIRAAARYEGRTVLLSTHNLPEAEELCDRVAIMRKGHLLVDGPPGELRRELARPQQVRLSTDRHRMEDLLHALPTSVTVDDLGGDSVVLGLPAVEPGIDVPQIVRDLVAEDIPLHRVDPVEPSLEDLYVALHRGSGHEPDSEPAYRAATP